MDKKIKPHRHLPSKTPHPKFQCCTQLYLTSSAFRVWFFVHQTQPRSPKTTLKFGGAGVDNNTARVWFHRPSTVRRRGCSLEHIDTAAQHRTFLGTADTLIQIIGWCGYLSNAFALSFAWTCAWHLLKLPGAHEVDFLFYYPDGHFCDRCEIWTLQCTNPCVFILPNSKLYDSISFSIAYSYCLIPITCVFTGKRRSGVCKRRKR